MRDAAPPARLKAPTGDRPPAARRRWYGPLLAVPTPVVFLVAAAVAAALLWRQGSLAQIGDSVRGVHPGTIAAILLAYAGSILILGLRWHILVRMAGGAPAWESSSEVFLTSVIVNYAAPIGLAVPTRAALSVRDLGLSPGQSGGVVAWDVGLDIMALALISAAWVAMGGFSSRHVDALTGDARLAVFGAVVLALGLIGALVAVRSAAVRSRLRGVLRQFLAQPVRSPGLALLAVVLTGLFWGMQLGVMAALLSVFGAAPSPSLLLGVMGLPVLIGMLSPIPGGAGVREALMAAAARLEGVPVGPVVLAAVAYRLALFIVTPAVWGGVRLAGGWMRER